MAEISHKVARLPRIDSMETKTRLSGPDRGSLLSNPAGEETTMRSPKRLARIAGVFYLLVGIFGGFAEGFVDPKMYLAGNAAATAGNVVANSGLVRLGVVAHLLDGTFFIFLAMALYILLQRVPKSVARAIAHPRSAIDRHHLSECRLPV